jgi:hypothetical protein
MATQSSDRATSEGRAVFRRRRRKRAPLSNRTAVAPQLPQAPQGQRWVLEGTYYADTGEAPASLAVFGDASDAEKGSELLRGGDSGALKQSWLNLDESGIDQFVTDAEIALRELRAKAENIRSSGTEPA